MTEPNAPDPQAFQSDHFEFQAPDGLAFEALDPAKTAVIDTTIPMAEEGNYNVLAEIQLGGEDDFLLLDVRESPLVGRFAFPFAAVEGGGMSFSQGIDFLLVSKDFDPTDSNSETGYKGLRQGQAVALGRAHHRERFDYSEETSKEHVVVSFDDSGNITVRDLNSTNGTLLRAEAMTQVPEEEYVKDQQASGLPISDHERHVRRAEVEAIRIQKARAIFGR